MSIIKKTLSQNDINERRMEFLERIFKSVQNLEVVEGTDERPTYLVAHGEIRHGAAISQIRTAITVRIDIHRESQDIEFSTNVGQLPNSSLGSTVVERLNHRFDGKFVSFDTEQDDNIDIVYASKQPADWLDKSRTRQELEHHAKIQALVSPILSQLSNYSQPAPKLAYQEIRDIARNFVDSSLDLQRSLPSVSTTYAPARSLRVPVFRQFEDEED